MNRALTLSLLAAVVVSCADARRGYWMGKGNAHATAKNYLEAQRAYSRAAEADPEWLEAWVQLGVVSLELNDNKRAAVAFDTATHIKPDRADLWHDLAVAYIRSGDGGRSATAAGRATQLAPQLASAWLLLCTAKGASEPGWAAGMTACQHAARLDPKSRKARVLLALAYDELQKKGLLAESPDDLALVDGEAVATAQRILDAKGVEEAISILDGLP